MTTGKQALVEMVSDVVLCKSKVELYFFIQYR